MTDSPCGYPGDRDEALVTYLYDDQGAADAAARAVFEVHLTTCVRCSEDLAALRGVRTQLARWSPPEPSFAVGSRQAEVGSRQAGVGSRQSGVASPQSPINQQSAINNQQWWRQLPAWAQVAAALLFLGVSAGVANLDVRYDHTGLSVRTGWSKPPSRDARIGAQESPAVAAAPSASPAAPWRADLAALERQLETEFHGAQVAAPVTPPQPQAARAAADAEIVRRVRALIDESEKRQQRELALRLGEAIRDVNAQRQADLVKVDRALGTVQNNLGVEVLKNRQQMNYYIRTSQRQ